jgi:hypothetical protein
MPVQFIRLKVQASCLCERLSKRPSAAGDKMFLLAKHTTAERLLQNIKDVLGVTPHETAVFSMLGMATDLEAIVQDCRDYMLLGEEPFFPVEVIDGAHTVTTQVSRCNGLGGVDRCCLLTLSSHTGFPCIFGGHQQHGCFWFK